MKQAVRFVPIAAMLTAAISIASWTYRFVDENVRLGELWFYVLVPAIAWLMLAGPLFLLQSDRRWPRVMAVIFLVPATTLWVMSVLVGFYGLRIH
ncbi:MAG TPA: hypothetical protein VIS31_00945 [Woeseiaceae bacterium]